MPGLNLVVIADPAARHLAVLEKLPPETNITVSDKPEALEKAVSNADVILLGMNRAGVLPLVWKFAGKVRWLHSLSAGVESTLFPALVESAVPMTNAAGVFRRSLAEFVMLSILFFAKDVRRMLRSQAANKWDQFDKEELSGRTLGIIGPGGLGRAAAERAKAFGMRVAVLRRRPEKSEGDKLIDRVFGPSGKLQLLEESDYVLAATPLTPETRGMIGETELRAMKSTGVIINIGRGPIIVESALIQALRERRIRGAALDVFDREPLPEDHPFWSMDNVLLSPHSADHTSTWLEDAMQFFVENFERFRSGAPLHNIVDKRAGY